jgi:hypothetical protein
MRRSTRAAIRAAKRGDTPALLRFVMRGGDVSCTDDEGTSLAVASARSGHLHALMLLLKAGAFLDAGSVLPHVRTCGFHAVEAAIQAWTEVLTGGDESMRLVAMATLRKIRRSAVDEIRAAVDRRMDLLAGIPTTKPASTAASRTGAVVAMLDDCNAWSEDARTCMFQAFKIERHASLLTPRRHKQPLVRPQLSTFSHDIEKALAKAEEQSAGLARRCQLLVLLQKNAPKCAIQNLWKTEQLQTDIDVLKEARLVFETDGGLISLGSGVAAVLLQKRFTIAVRYQEIAPGNGLHCGKFSFFKLDEKLGSTFGNVADRARQHLTKIYWKTCSHNSDWRLDREDVRLIFGPRRWFDRATLHNALAEAVDEDETFNLTPLSSHPAVGMIVSVVIVNGKIPVAKMEPRVSRAEVQVMMRTGLMRVGKPTSGQPEEDALDPCAICHFDMRFRDGIRLACGHAFHSDCVGRWASCSASPACPLCREPIR